MLTHTDETFTDKDITLDNARWVRCRFERCTITYAGGDVSIEQPTFVGCTRNYVGSALIAVTIEREFHRNEMEAIVKELSVNNANRPSEP